MNFNKIRSNISIIYNLDNRPRVKQNNNTNIVYKDPILQEHRGLRKQQQQRIYHIHKTAHDEQNSQTECTGIAQNKSPEN